MGFLFMGKEFKGRFYLNKPVRSVHLEDFRSLNHLKECFKIIRTEFIYFQYIFSFKVNESKLENYCKKKKIPA